jgi:DNA-directed RNA polymerase subunit K/omega
MISIFISVDNSNFLMYNNPKGEFMKPRIESRNIQIDTEKCVQQAGGRYDMVIATAQRLRELKRKARENKTHVTAIDALLEMQAGQIDMITYMAKVK